VRVEVSTQGTLCCPYVPYGTLCDCTVYGQGPLTHGIPPAYPVVPAGERDRGKSVWRSPPPTQLDPHVPTFLSGPLPGSSSNPLAVGQSCAQQHFTPFSAGWSETRPSPLLPTRSPVRLPSRQPLQPSVIAAATVRTLASAHGCSTVEEAFSAFSAHGMIWRAYIRVTSYCTRGGCGSCTWYLGGLIGRTLLILGCRINR